MFADSKGCGDDPPQAPSIYESTRVTLCYPYGVRRNLRLRPCRRPSPVNSQLLTRCLLEWIAFYTHNRHLGGPEAPFRIPWVTILVIQGCTGTPNGHLEVQISILWVLCMIWEPSWDPLWRHFLDFSVIWGGKVADSFQTYVFDDPGLEMLPECSGCMC